MSRARVLRVGPEERAVSDPTPGQTREEAFATERMWCGVVRAEPGETSGWHHHGDHSTIAFVVRGVKRLESGRGGRDVGDPTPGIVRETAVVSGGVWSGLARTASGAISGWHHHAANETCVYVEAGVFRVEFGPGGSDVIEARPGDFVYVPPGVVHRESNPSDQESKLVVVRAGSDPPTINADGPEEG